MEAERVVLLEGWCLERNRFNNVVELLAEISFALFDLLLLLT